MFILHRVCIVIRYRRKTTVHPISIWRINIVFVRLFYYSYYMVVGTVYSRSSITTCPFRSIYTKQYPRIIYYTNIIIIYEFRLYIVHLKKKKRSNYQFLFNIFKRLSVQRTLVEIHFEQFDKTYKQRRLGNACLRHIIVIITLLFAHLGKFIASGPGGNETKFIVHIVGNIRSLFERYYTYCNVCTVGEQCCSVGVKLILHGVAVRFRRVYLYAITAIIELRKYKDINHEEEVLTKKLSIGEIKTSTFWISKNFLYLQMVLACFFISSKSK